MLLSKVEEALNDKSLPGTIENIIKRESASGREYYCFLYNLARLVKPSLMVELGTWRGVSSMCLASGNAEGSVVTIDRFPMYKPEEFPKDIKRENVTYLYCDSMNDDLNYKGVDLLFIDTEHDGLRPLYEYEFWLPRMSEEHIVLFDDINLNPEMRDFWEAFNPKGIKVEVPIHGEAGFGLVVSQKGDE